MKLLQLNVTSNWGSTGKIAEGIGLAAMKRGWESYVAFGRYVNPGQSEAIKVGSQWDIYSHYAKSRFLNQEGLGSQKATKKLITQIKEISPDIIHLHNIHDHWLNYPLLFEFLKAINTPIVWTFHDCWAFTGWCGYFDNLECHNWKNECRDCRFAPSGKKRSSFNLQLKKTHFSGLGERLIIVPVSDWLKKLTQETFLSQYDIEVIHNGVNTDIFQPSSFNENYILGVALPWSERKGLKDFIQLRDILPEEIEIKLVGVTDKQIKSLPAGITGIKRTHNQKELAELYSGAITFVNPTHEDNFPTVNLEALACGTPVVTYNTGGSPEAIDSDTGIVVEKGDVNGLKDAVERITQSHTKYTVEQCRERVVTNFNAERQFNRYIDLYERLLSQ